MIRRPPRSTRTDTLLPYTTLVRSRRTADALGLAGRTGRVEDRAGRDLRRLQRREATEPGIPAALAGRRQRSLAKAIGRRDFGRRVDDDSGGRFGYRGGQPLIEVRSEEHTSELQSLMRISYAVFCLKKKKKNRNRKT